MTTFMLPGIEALHSSTAGPIDITPFPPGADPTEEGPDAAS